MGPSAMLALSTCRSTAVDEVKLGKGQAWEAWQLLLTCMHLRCPWHSCVLSQSTNSSLPSVHSFLSRWSSQNPQR